MRVNQKDIDLNNWCEWKQKISETNLINKAKV